MMRLLLTAMCGAVFVGSSSGADAPKVIQHVTVYSKAGRYGGWPANRWLWSWGNEILLGFSAAYTRSAPSTDGFHFAG